MYRLIRSSTNIFGMADELGELLENMRDVSKELKEHVGKCIIWGKDFTQYNHWVEDEICTWIDKFARKKTKSRLKASAVRKNLFRSIGSEYYDAYNWLLDIYEDRVRFSNPYPEVDVGPEYGERFFHAYYELADVVSNYLASHRYKMDVAGRRASYKDEIAPLVHSVLDKYC